MVDKTTWRKNELVSSRRHAPTVYRPLRYLQAKVKEPIKTGEASVTLHIARPETLASVTESLFTQTEDSFNLDNSSPLQPPESRRY